LTRGFFCHIIRGAFPAPFPASVASFPKLLFSEEQKVSETVLPVMKKETIFLSLGALLIGLLVAGGVFYSYQYFTKPSDADDAKIISLNPTPTPVSSNSDELMLDEPKDESVVDKKTVTVTGKTLPGSMVIVTSENDEQVATPADNGNFSLTTTLGDGVNIIEVLSILPSGEERKVVRSVTYSTESF
jgi:hypothetical protein